MARNPWLDIPLADYEGHMSASSVAQAPMLAAYLRDLVCLHRPKTLAILGVAGGNGLELLAEMSLTRVVAVDMNADYLKICADRHAQQFREFETVHCDLSTDWPNFEPVELVFAALILEYVDVGNFLNYAPSLVTAGGRIAFVLQNEDKIAGPVTKSGIASLNALAAIHQPVDLDLLISIFEINGFTCEQRKALQSTAGKEFQSVVLKRP